MILNVFFKKIIFQNRYVALETPPPFMAKTILNFHFDYLNPSLNSNANTNNIWAGENMRPSSWQYRFRGVREPPTTLQQQDKVRLLISFWSYIWLTFDVCFDSVLFTLRLTYILNVCIDLMSCHLPFSIFGQKCHDLCDILGQTWKKLGIFLV